MQVNRYKNDNEINVVARSAKFLTGLTIILVGFVWMLCARGVRDSIILEQPGVVLAVHQDDFSGFTCIGYRGISE